jgi:hypothetical protein
MKTIKFFGLAVAAGALFFAGAKDISAGQQNYSYSRDTTNGGIRMKHSPVLGINVPLAVRIDGRNAGAFAKGHVFHRYLAPGPHRIDVSRPGPGRIFDTWRGIIEVRPGEIQSFVIKATLNEVILLPVGQVD